MRFAVAVLAWHAAAAALSPAAGAHADVTAAAETVGHACCDAVDRYDRDEDGDAAADCRKCRRYCSGFAAGGKDGDAAAEQPFSRRCACGLLAPPCRGRVGYVIGPDETAGAEDETVDGEDETGRDEGQKGRDEDETGRDEGQKGRDEDETGRRDEDVAPSTRWTDSAWYSNARALASGCSITAIVFAVIVYAGVLEPRDYSNFAKHYAFWLLVMATLTLTDDLELIRDLDTEFGYLKLFTICVTNNLQVMMSYEVYNFLKSIQEINTYYSQMFRDNLYYHTLCYGGAIGVTGTCFFIEVNGQLFSNVHFDFDNIKILSIFYLLPGLVNICFNLVVFYYTYNLKTQLLCNHHQDITRIYNEKLLIRKQLFGLVSMLWLIDVICITAQLFGMNYSVLQDLKALQGVGTFVILVFKRNVMDQIKKRILAHTYGVRPDAL